MVSGPQEYSEWPLVLRMETLWGYRMVALLATSWMVTHLVDWSETLMTIASLVHLMGRMSALQSLGYCLVHPWV